MKSPLTSAAVLALAAYPAGIAAVREAVPLKARGFALTEVRLLDGPFRDAMVRDQRSLLDVDLDRLMHTFRLNALLPSSAAPLGGWEAPDVELRGHTLGHFLTASALMYAATADARFKTRADAVVAELVKIQQALAARFNAGYLSAFPEDTRSPATLSTCGWPVSSITAPRSIRWRAARTSWTGCTPTRRSRRPSAPLGSTSYTYNMLKLTRQLFQWAPSAELMDFYERGLLNHILASQDPATGGVIYYCPLKPGAFKTYSKPDASFWCCVGTGMENHAKYADTIYFRDDASLYVNRVRT